MAKKLKQQVLPGTEPVHNEKLTQKAEDYHEAKMARVRLSAEEKEAKDDLISAMEEAGETFYETPDGLVVTLTKKAGVKTKKRGEDDDGEDS